MTRSAIVSMVLAATALGGCNKSPENPPPNSSSNTTATPAPDNTGVNRRDRGNATKTPPDQAEGTAADRAITADVRRAITSDSSMSSNAKNIKIITTNGAVTLRGPVDSEAERTAIEAKAKAVSGVTSVDNQLEVKPG